jgi:hypothetical protein
MEQDRGAPSQQNKTKKSVTQRWAELQPTKTTLFWSCIVTAIVTMVIGFNWGGWMTGGAAQDMSDKSSKEAVVARLAPICVTKFLQDPEKGAKLEEIKAMSSYSRGDYIRKQGWATMSGEEKADRNVAAECAKLLMLIPEIIPEPVAEPAPQPTTEVTPAAPNESTPTATTP